MNKKTSTAPNPDGPLEREEGELTEERVASLDTP